MTSRVERPGSDGEHLLQTELGTGLRADRFYDDQVRDRLNPRMREFVARQEMFFLSTADRRGECDSTFRAGPPGFVRILDDRTLTYPEYRGNGVMASLGNIRENPHVGILLIDFARDRIGLHINGRALLIPDERMRAEHPELPDDPVPGRRPQMWVEVEVEEAYIHCSKHIPRLVAAPLQKGSAAGGGRSWGTDDVRRKGGDHFGAAAERIPVQPVPAAPAPVQVPVPVPVARVVAAPPGPAERRRTRRARRLRGWFLRQAG
ncbi:pyridoxamine 5'-phosphate oxidase family protein [Streptomyces sp. RKAG337]|uniref:pyridoxamine 5'-phosphate oxidase family protein n=1 Tax=Streptomyces sp. RKAG337 TaxID=2893404 RepID=UPI0020337E39|nr:pyridoxamine 5'-phosphate oxidase family protein [Streptomyces sp. RKAG337]MCM2427453.1 pyridoxamine 5'-phosphate oxidase family protein [Streptomyces sp. RKAG337]